MDALRGHSVLLGDPWEDAEPGLNPGRHQARSQDILHNNWPVPFRDDKVVKYKGRLHNWPRLKQTKGMGHMILGFHLL